jgi:hypothetical protein
MAKNAERLAGLAALGALAYMNRDKFGGSKGPKGKEDTGVGYKSTETREDEGPTADKKTKSDVLEAITKPKEKSNDAAGNQGVISKPVVERKVKPADLPKVEAKVDQENKTADEDKPLYKQSNVTIGGVEKRIEGNKPMPSLKKVESKAAARQASIATDAMKNASRASGRKANLSGIDQIPGQSRSGPIGGERVSGTELSRNLSNTAAALTPIGGGFGKVGAELATSGRAQRAYNAAQAERRAAEGMSPAEALAARQEAVQAAREAKTLNPNAWLAGPKGMAENFRKGGAVKKMASGGMTASRRADGIATRGKTKCKMY